MRIARSIPQLRRAVEELRRDGSTVGFVPTMGCLHEGHASLMREAGRRTDRVVASVYVNPTQFLPGEDFAAYPRQLEADRGICARAGVDLLYTPTDSVMYPPGFSTRVEETVLSGPLCGTVRPGHFGGVATVVTKLLNQVRPDTAFFGQKDAQQALVIRRLVRDLDLPCEVRICPIVRDRDGLALSSRNRYLSPEERERALALSRALAEIERRFRAGEVSTSRLARAGRSVLAATAGVELQYLEFRDGETLAPVARVRGTTLVAVAAKVGTTRLIDNTVLDGRKGRVLSHL